MNMMETQINMTLKIVRPCIAEGMYEVADQSFKLKPGDEVEYVAHLPGGMLKVFFGVSNWIIHPGATDIDTKGK